VNKTRENSGFSIVLPVLNEKLNLEFLIPELMYELQKLFSVNFEIIVVDDGSVDSTQGYLRTLNKLHPQVILFERDTEPSLPKSIEFGIRKCSYDLVAWMDADGSMPVEDLVRLIKNQMGLQNSVVIGSRFVQGGGFKGQVTNENNSWLRVYMRLNNSPDGIFAVVLSRILNVYLRICLRSPIKDLTSGFVVGPSELFKRLHFVGSYGDYFPYLVWQLKSTNCKIIEIPYICKPRRFGYSKTGTTLYELIKRGFPYLKAGMKISLLSTMKRGPIL
jgi:dolichol-phosphate mannosyltransferase